MKSKLFLLTVILSLFISVNAYADKTTVTGLFLGVPIGAKPTALGGAYTALAEGVYGLYWNPAGIGKTQNYEIMFAHNNYMLDVNQQFIGITKKIKNTNHNLGLSVNILDNGDFEGTLITDATNHLNTGNFTAKDYAVGLTYGTDWNKKYNFGATVKYINSKISDAKASGFAFDAGWLYNTEIKEIPFDFGFVVTNIGSKLKFDREKEELPLTAKFGISAKFDVAENIALRPTFDNIYMNNDKYRISGGMEIQIMENYFARCGYDSFNEISSGLTLGFGVSFNKKLDIDYSYSDYDDLSNSHKFSVLYKF